MKNIVLAAMVAFVSLCVAACGEKGSAEIRNAYAFATNAANGAVFLEIVNTGKTDVTITSAHSDAAGEAQLHTMAMAGDVMEMRQVDSLSVASGQTLSLTPSGDHIMLMGLKAPLTEGQKFGITLVTSAGPIAAEVIVNAPGVANQAAAAETATPAATEEATTTPTEEEVVPATETEAATVTEEPAADEATAEDATPAATEAPSQEDMEAQRAEQEKQREAIRAEEEKAREAQRKIDMENFRKKMEEDMKAQQAKMEADMKAREAARAAAPAEKAPAAETPAPEAPAETAPAEEAPAATDAE